MPNKSTVNHQYINGPEILITGSGNIIEIEQEVALMLSGEGTIIEIEQQVELIAAGNTIKLEVTQIVQTPITGLQDKVARYGWNVFLYINGASVPNNQITGEIKINRVENDSASMTFVLYPPRGALGLRGYEGKPVYCNVQTPEGVFRIFTGRINTADIDFNKRMITFTCMDNRRQAINTTYANYIKGIGYYDPAQKATDAYEELERRLETVPYSFEFDTYGNGILTSLYAKGTPDFTFTAPYVSYDAGRDPRVMLVPRSKVINTVNINYSYRYQRLHHVECPYTWVLNATNREFLLQGISVPRREVIETAVKGTGWPKRGEIAYTPVIPAGFYKVGNPPINVGVNWSSSTYAVGNATTTDSNGNTVNVVDSNGNIVKTAIQTSSTDYSGDLCFGAAFKLTKQFSQNISEDYTILVQAQTSVNNFGVVSKSESGGTESTYDNTVWDDYQVYRAPPSGVSITYDAFNSSYYWNETTGLATFQNAMYTALNRAYTTIMKSHRENRVVFSVPIKPRVQLYHTAYLNTTSHENVTIQAKGKVYSVTHVLNPQSTEAYTTIELALSITNGSSTPSPISLPTRPTNSITPFRQAIGLSSHYGLEPQPSWTGWIANKWVNNRVPGGTDWRRTTYPESFVIDTPEIPTAYTNGVALPASASYNVAIVNDTLNVII